MPTIELNYVYTRAQVEIFFPKAQSKYTIVTKGRRFGATRGAAQACIEDLLDGNGPWLWVDTINGNIDRYFERYFMPALKGIDYSWNQQKKELKIYGQWCDFRSADRPENIEGFGYRKIFLNEAGIILEDDYLYDNAILPMMLDFPDSQLIAAGVPKGKYKKDGSEHKFYTLAQRAEADITGKYRRLAYTSYDNPFLNEEDIRELEDELIGMGDDIKAQEIDGEFVEKTGSNHFFQEYDEKVHNSEDAVFSTNKRLLIIIDFNLNPFAVNFAHMWRDGQGEHFHFIDEGDIKAGSIPAMADLIRERYEKNLFECWITGDAMGTHDDITQRDNSSYYEQLLKELKLKPSVNLKVPAANPTHSYSRGHCNYVLKYFPDLKVNQKTCPNTIRDLKILQCDAFGSIIKRDRKKIAQQGDHGDNVRYAINTFLQDWYLRHKKR